MCTVHPKDDQTTVQYTRYWYWLVFSVLSLLLSYGDSWLALNMSSTTQEEADRDKRFLSCIQSAIQTVQAWDADPILLAECRALIPWKDLIPPVAAFGMPETKSKYQQDDDYLYSCNALLLKRLTKYFQTTVMTWVNQPPCRTCASTEMESKGSRGPQTHEEIQGGASRVEGKSMTNSCLADLFVDVRCRVSQLTHLLLQCTSAENAPPRPPFLVTIQCGKFFKRVEEDVENMPIYLDSSAELQDLQRAMFWT